MAQPAFLLIEVLHDTGSESLWVTGPDVRFGDDGRGPCSLHGSSMGAWIELLFSEDAPVTVIDSSSAMLDGRPLTAKQRVDLGSSIMLGNAIVTLIAIAPQVPSDARLYTSPATTEIVIVDDKEHAIKPVSDVPPAIQKVPENEPISAQIEPVVVASSTETAPVTETAVQPVEEKYYAIIFEDNIGRREELSANEFKVGSGTDADLMVVGKLVADKHLMIRRKNEAFQVDVLAGRDRTSLNGLFEESASITLGQWIVAGSARIMFDKGNTPLESVKPPMPLKMGASFSPINQSRVRRDYGELFARAITRLSPLLIFSVVFHLILFTTLFMITIMPPGAQIDINMTSEFEQPDEKIEDIEDEETETTEREETVDDIDYDDFVEEIDESLLSPVGLSDLETGLGIDAGSMLPDSDLSIGRLPYRPTGNTKTPTINELRGRGLDVVFLFDTTASMGWLIDDVKSSIEAIYSITFKLVRTTRFSCVAYRDVKPVEGYVTKGMPFTNDLTELKDFLNRLDAAGGGDLEEAVQEGLKSVGKLKWRTSAYRVVILFADAPSHKEHEQICLSWVKKFTRNKGFFHCVHAIRGVKSDEETKDFLDQMAEAGGGAMVPINQEQKVLEHILRLVLGEANTKDVEKALAEYQAKKPKK